MNYDDIIEYGDVSLFESKSKLREAIKKAVPKVMSKAEFNRLPQWKKRVMIAEDALALLRTQLIVSCSGTYVTNDYSHGKDLSATSLEGQCQIFANGACHVCAKGALFMSTVMRTNKMKVGNVLHANTEEKVVDEEKVFDAFTFDLIERAFERSECYASDTFLSAQEDLEIEHQHQFDSIASGNETKRGCLSKKQFDMAVLCRRAVKFGERYEDETDRLAAILINLIRNKGEFIPTKIVSKKDIRKALATK